MHAFFSSACFGSNFFQYFFELYICEAFAFGSVSGRLRRRVCARHSSTASSWQERHSPTASSWQDTPGRLGSVKGDRHHLAVAQGMLDAAAIAYSVEAANASWCRAQPPPPVTGFSRMHPQPPWRRVLSHIYPELLRRGLALGPAVGDVYEYGVLNGNSIIEMTAADRSLVTANTIGAHPEAAPFAGARLWACDTFAGMPADAFDDDASARVRQWAPGKMAPTALAHSTIKDPAVGVRFVQQRLNETLGPSQAASVRYVVGPYSESLKPTLPTERGMRPATYVDIDVDLYASTRDALRFLYTHGLIVPGTLIGYDDFWSGACAAHHAALAALNVSARASLKAIVQSAHASGTRPAASLAALHRHLFDSPAVGEWRAHAELAREFNAKLVCVAGPCVGPPQRYSRCDIHNTIGPVFLVQSVGGVTAGVRGAPSSLGEWPISPGGGVRGGNTPRAQRRGDGRARAQGERVFDSGVEAADDGASAAFEAWPWAYYMLARWDYCQWAGWRHGASRG